MTRIPMTRRAPKAHAFVARPKSKRLAPEKVCYGSDWEQAKQRMDARNNQGKVIISHHMKMMQKIKHNLNEAMQIVNEFKNENSSIYYDLILMRINDIKKEMRDAPKEIRELFHLLYIKVDEKRKEAIHEENIMMIKELHNSLFGRYY